MDLSIAHQAATGLWPLEIEWGAASCFLLITYPETSRCSSTILARALAETPKATLEAFSWLSFIQNPMFCREQTGKNHVSYSIFLPSHCAETYIGFEGRIRMALTELELQKLYFQAGWNWVSWIDDFGCSVKSPTLPVLLNKARFAKFVKVYSVLRYHKPEEKEFIREWLNGKSRVVKATESLAGEGIDKLAARLKKVEPKHQRHISLISKLAAFTKPAWFIAFDQYAEKGTRIIMSRTKSGHYKNYAAYLADVNLVLKSPVGIAIRSYISNLPLPTKNRKAFAMRMLDCYLMGIGGRP